MRENDFQEWMRQQGNSDATLSTRISDARRLERHYGDLDEAFDRDGFDSIRRELSYSAADQAADRPNPSRIETTGDLYATLSNFRSVLSVYAQFRGGQSNDQTQADGIRQFIAENYVEPARKQGIERFSVRAGDVHSAMHLQNAMPAVCSVLRGRKLRELAGIVEASREGPENGGNAVFGFEFLPDQPFGVPYAELLLRQRFGAPTSSSEKMVGFALPDGRQLALQRDIAKVQLWFEAQSSDPPVPLIQHYEPRQGRHSNLPDRLRHSPPAGQSARAVISSRADNVAELNALLSWYEGNDVPLNRAALEQFKQQFLARYPDFEPGGFARNDGGYFEEERAYKDALLKRAREALDAAEELSGEALGAQFLDLLISRESGLLGWRTDARIKNMRSANPGELDRLVGELVRGSDPIAVGIEKFVQRAWSVLAANQDKSLPYSESRNIPSMIMALARPDQAYGINTDPVYRTYRALFGASPFANQPLKAEEYERVLVMAHAIETIMRDAWQWQPRDLWDVQGFIWAVNRADTPAFDPGRAERGARHVPPTNLILYGPPGTGKTYATAYEAVRLCDGTAPEGRRELKQRYDSLVEAGQIAFVTFHQSYAYEDFVEGLRPSTSATDEVDPGAAGGFRLEPRRGVFREIALLAEQARKTANQPGGFDLAGRDFIKMSLGRAGVEDHIYDAAIEGNYIVLGWGGEVDWSDPRYESYQAVFDKWNELEP
jgi:hypothetical protein